MKFNCHQCGVYTEVNEKDLCNTCINNCVETCLICNAEYKKYLVTKQAIDGWELADGDICQNCYDTRVTIFNSILLNNLTNNFLIATYNETTHNDITHETTRKITRNVPIINGIPQINTRNNLVDNTFIQKYYGVFTATDNMFLDDSFTHYTLLKLDYPGQ